MSNFDGMFPEDADAIIYFTEVEPVPKFGVTAEFMTEFGEKVVLNDITMSQDRESSRSHLWFSNKDDMQLFAQRVGEVKWTLKEVIWNEV